MNILEKIYSSITYCDGGMGTLLQARGLRPGEMPERWGVARADDIVEIHARYLAAGCHVITTNTFGANLAKYSLDELKKIIPAGIRNVRRAMRDFSGDRYVAFDIGPTGKLLRPLGDLPFEEAVGIFAESVKIAAACDPDLILIETMNDSYEAKAAVIAAKENCDLPVFVTTVYDERGKLMTGADPAAMVAMLEGLGVDALGMNCSLGPDQMKDIVPQIVAEASVPVIVNPNAGLPRTEGGRTVFSVGASHFAETMVGIVKSGATIVGGCCGTTPDYMRRLVEETSRLPFNAPRKKSHTVVSSYTHAVRVGEAPVLIGERINPTGKKRFKQALRDGDIDYILGEGVAQQDAGAHILDVNVGLPEIDEPSMMEDVVRELQAVTDLPIQLDTVNGEAMERAMRAYNGKPMVNSVNGKPESMAVMFPLVKKYGGVLIALTIGEQGIPDTAEGRLAIAADIVAKAEAQGIARRDIIVDPLAMAVSSDPRSALVTLDSIRLIESTLGVHTSLGVSNISFGLPARDMVTATFFALALQNGLDCAIMNPFSGEMQKIVHAYRVLKDLDENCAGYIAFASSQAAAVQPAQAAAVPPPSAGVSQEGTSPLMHAIIKGLKEKAGSLAAAMVSERAPLEVVNAEIIPALDIVGQGFEAKTVFLPQLLMSAEAAKMAFEAVKSALASSGGGADKGKVILATVKGDIHDIGKNIVKVLLSNYGFQVLDLGKDVAPETICECALKHDIRLVGLSALMTTTVPAMEETIRLLRESGSRAKVVVGGAVLTQEYADMIHADKYCRDAMETVRYAEEVFSS